MTNQEIINYYANLLILQYRSKPKAYATVQTLVTPVVMDQLPDAVQNAFELESAVGVQLDVIGKYAGVNRLGADFSGAVTLSDADFRTLIKLAILQNSAGSSLYDIQQLISIFFPGTLQVFDHLGMRMSYYLDSNSFSVSLAEFFILGGYFPVPMGVQLSALIFVPSIDNWFGFSRNAGPGVNVHGFNTNAQYDMDCHWLNNDDTIDVV